MDAPPTGRITRFLNVNAEVAGAGPDRADPRPGRERRGAAEVAADRRALRDDARGDAGSGDRRAAAELGAAGLPVGGVVVNMARTSLLDAAAQKAARPGQLDASLLAAGLKRAPYKVKYSQVAAMAEETAEHAERVALESREREDLAALGLPVVELPLLPDSVDLGGLYQLADVHARAGDGRMS